MSYILKDLIFLFRYENSFFSGYLRSAVFSLGIVYAMLLGVGTAWIITLNTTLTVVTATGKSDFRSEGTNTFVPVTDIVVCTDRQTALTLAKLFASVGTNASRYSVAYDRYWNAEPCSFQSSAVADMSLALFQHQEKNGEFVLLFNESDSADLVTGEGYVIVLSPDIMSNIFRCQKNSNDGVFDSTRKCWRDL